MTRGAIDKFQDFRHHLRMDIDAMGGIKKVAAMLWPTNSDAAGRLRACLSAAHPQKLDAEELLTIKRMARLVGSVETVNYEARELGFRVHWIRPEDENVELQRRFNEAISIAEELVKRLQR